MALDDPLAGTVLDEFLPHPAMAAFTKTDAIRQNVLRLFFKASPASAACPNPALVAFCYDS